MDVNSILAAATLPQTSVELCLDGALADEVEALEAAIAKARQVAKEANSLSAGGDIQPLQEQLDKLRDRAKDTTVRFVVRAVGRKRMTELLAAHPPRKDKAKDTLIGANEDTLSEALIREGLVEPELSGEQLRALVDEHLSEGQYKELANAAYFANRRSVSVPFS